MLNDYCIYKKSRRRKLANRFCIRKKDKKTKIYTKKVIDKNCNSG